MPSQFKLAIVEDNQILAAELEQVFLQQNWVVYVADCGEELDDIMRHQDIKVIILDLNLPGEDGIEILKRIKKAYPSTGIIILTARITSNSKIEGYESGADVYITKPAKAQELIFAANNLLQRLVKDVEFKRESHVLEVQALLLRTRLGTPIKLTSTEANILRIMAISSSRQIDSDRLKSELGDAEITKENIEVAISRLRSKLKRHHEFASIDTIKAIWGKGYQLCIPLEVRVTQ